MKRRLRLLLLILTALVGGTQPAIAQRQIALSTTQQTDDRLLAQQKLLTDAVAAVFVALRTSFEIALTNQLQSAAVLAAYTNTLDAAQAEQVARAIDQWALGVTTTLEGFLAGVAEQNDALRTEIREDVASTVDQQVSDAVARLATGTVLEDVLAGESVELTHNTTHAIHVTTRAVSVMVSPITELSGVTGDLPRYTATAIIHVDQDVDQATLTVKLPAGTSAWATRTTWPLAAGSYTRCVINQLTSSLYTVEVTPL